MQSLCRVQAMFVCPDTEDSPSISVTYVLHDTSVLYLLQVAWMMWATCCA